MKINKLVDINYEILVKRFKNISKSTFESGKDKIDIVQVNVQKNEATSRITSDLYIFKNDKLISRDVTLKTKDGQIKKIETDVFEDGHSTTIEEINKKFSYPLKTTYDKIITTIGDIRSKCDGAIIIDLFNKLRGKFLIDKNIPVTIIKKTTNKLGEFGCEKPFYTVLIKGKKNSIRIDGDVVHGIATYKDKEKDVVDMLGLVNTGAPEEYKVLNNVLNHFLKKFNKFE